MDVAVLHDLVAAFELGELDQDGDADDFGAGLLDEFAAGLERAAGGEQVVDDDDLAALADGIGVDLEAVGAVFEGVVDAVDAAGELAGFANGDEPGGEGLSDGGAEDEAAGLGADDEFDTLAAVGVGHQLDGEGETPGIRQQRREILEENPGLGEVGDVADEGVEVHGGEETERRGDGETKWGDGRGSRPDERWVNGTGSFERRPDRSLRPASPRHFVSASLRLCLHLRSGMTSKPVRKPSLEIVEPVGKRVLIRKDEDKKQTKTGIHLPDKIEIPTLTGRVVAISRQVERDEDYTIKQYDRVLFNPKHAIPVEFEGDNRLFVIPIEDVVAIFRKAEEAE